MSTVPNAPLVLLCASWCPGLVSIEMPGPNLKEVILKRRMDSFDVDHV